MCVQCLANADFVVTSGILGAASARVGLRRHLPALRIWYRRVTRGEDRTAAAPLTLQP